jgi:hypothetical protein
MSDRLYWTLTISVLSAALIGACWLMCDVGSLHHSDSASAMHHRMN